MHTNHCVLVCKVLLHVQYERCYHTKTGAFNTCTLTFVYGLMPNTHILNENYLHLVITFLNRLTEEPIGIISDEIETFKQWIYKHPFSASLFYNIMNRQLTSLTLLCGELYNELTAPQYKI